MAKTYGTYKDSGIAWIGEIPGEWEVCRLKSQFKASKGLNITKENLKEEGYPVISYGQIHAKNNCGTSISQELIRFISNSYIDSNPECLTNKGCFIFADTSEDIEGCGNAVYVNSGSIFAGYHTIILKPKFGTSNKYLAYLFLTDCWRSQIRASVSGIKVLSITQKIINTTSILLPPLSVQQSISSFLETKCGEIDSLISIQEEMISELLAYKQSVITEAVTKGLDKKAKMKNSGVEWIGDIPEEWEVRRIKNICIMGPTDDYSHPYESVGYAPMNTIRYGNINAGIIEKSKLSSGLTYFADNDIVMAKVTPCFENGNIAIAKNLHNGCAYGSSELFVFRATNILTEFLFYLLQNEKFKGLCCSTMTGTGGLKRVSPSFVYNSFIPLPPLPVQQAIATYLDEKTSQIDSLIALKQSKIESLKEYKKSIIYEYVTGKKRV